MTNYEDPSTSFKEFERIMKQLEDGLAESVEVLEQQKKRKIIPSITEFKLKKLMKTGLTRAEAERKLIPRELAHLAQLKQQRAK